MRVRRFLKFVIAAAAFAIVCVIAVAVIMQTAWFRNFVRLRVISLAEDVSGGRVELRRFDYDWRTLTVTLTGVTLHGTEPAGATPLLKANSARIGLRIVSLLRRDIDLSLLTVDGPVVSITVKADGTTNIPAPRLRSPFAGSRSQQLLTLAVRHFEIRDGAVEIAQRRYGLNLRGDQLWTDLRYRSGSRGYAGSLSFGRLSVDRNEAVSGNGLPPGLLPGFLPGLPPVLPPSFHWSVEGGKASIVFSPDHLALNNIVIASGATHVSGSAALDHFADPVETVRLKAAADMGEIGRSFQVAQLRSGSIEIVGNGSLHRGVFSFSGSAAGRKIEYKGTNFDVTGAALDSLLVMSNDGLRLSRLRVNALDAEVSGQAQISNFRHFHFDGRISHLAVKEGARLFKTWPAAWTGFASGPLSGTGELMAHSRDFIWKSRLEISAPVTSDEKDVPVSGAIQLTYDQSSNSVRFEQSHLNLPHSTIDGSGVLGKELDVTLETGNLADLQSIVSLTKKAADMRRWPVHLASGLDAGSLRFSGLVQGPIANPAISGSIAAHRIRYLGLEFDQIASKFSATADEVRWSELTGSLGRSQVTSAGQIGLLRWVPAPASAVNFRAVLKNADLAQMRSGLRLVNTPPVTGTAGLSADIAGNWSDPQLTGQIDVTAIGLYGQRIDRLLSNLKVSQGQLAFDGLKVRLGQAALVGHGSYQKSGSGWLDGYLDVQAETPGVSLRELVRLHKLEPGLDGRLQGTLHVSGKVLKQRFAPDRVDGHLSLRDVLLDGVSYGTVAASAITKDRTLMANISGRLGGSPFSGRAAVELFGNYESGVDMTVAPVSLSAVQSLIPSLRGKSLPFEGVVQMAGTLHGPLNRPELLSGSVHLDHLSIAPPKAERPLLNGATHEELTIKNVAPIVIALDRDEAKINQFQLAAKDSRLTASGKFGLSPGARLELQLKGDVNARLLQDFEPGVTSAGTVRIDAKLTGAVLNPSLTGIVTLANLSVYPSDLTNGIDHANGSIRFDRNRATIERLSATSGGGEVEASGFVTFGGGAPVVFHLDSTAKSVRIRYNGVSVTFDAQVKYTGTVASSLLTGAVTVTKAAFNPSTDVGTLFAAESSRLSSLAPQNSYLNRVRLDLNFQSASNLDLTTSLSQDVQADIDLRVRGTPDRPIVLGRCALNEGEIQFFGDKYTINRGEVNFFNPLTIEPVLNLDLQTRARGITINITISGPLEKLNVNYRSDPPLQPSEIIALLATGKTPETGAGFAANQTVSPNAILSTGGNTILGSAISPTSSRLQRFFGVTHLKIDPMVQGIEDVPQARVTLEQEISKQVTITYVTNLSRTAEQIFRLEWALNREYSFVAIRDQNGLFGIDLQYKHRFK